MLWLVFDSLNETECLLYVVYLLNWLWCFHESALEYSSCTPIFLSYVIAFLRMNVLIWIEYCLTLITFSILGVLGLLINFHASLNLASRALFSRLIGVLTWPLDLDLGFRRYVFPKTKSHFLKVLFLILLFLLKINENKWWLKFYKNNFFTKKTSLAIKWGCTWKMKVHREDSFESGGT